MNTSTSSNTQNWPAVRRTLEMILPLADTFAFMFYNRFFEYEPAARSLFKADMSTQRKKVINLLAFALRGLDRPYLIEKELRRLGRHHAQYQISRQQYEHLNEAIIWAFGETLGSNFNEESRQAWHHALNAITTIMLAAAAETKAMPAI